MQIDAAENPSAPDAEAATIAAVDLGSNSFHMIVASQDNGQVKVLDRLREPVRLAAGLTPEHRLGEEARARALACLERFGQRLREFPSGAVRAVGTNTLRRANRDGAFLEQARAALGHPIEIISGVEEARLIYQGVSHSVAAEPGRRLVMDIGGGSTELIIGEGFSPLYMESLYMGCVSMSQRFFPDGEISKEAMRRAVLAAQLEFRPMQARIRNLGWLTETGASGTIKAVREIIINEGWSEQGITYPALKRLRKALLAAGHADRLKLQGLSEERRPVLAGGFAILFAAFEVLKMNRMNVSTGALREGLLFDLLGRMRHEDIREATVAAMAQRYQVDTEHALRVERLALQFFDQVQVCWGLDEQWRQWLHWAACLHEVGLIIAHSQYHKHGAYLIQNSDMAGFSLGEQARLASCVRGHRRKLGKELWKSQPPQVLYITLLLRLAVLLQRGRSDQLSRELELSCAPDGISLRFPTGWLEAHPLTRAGLEEERDYLAAAGLRLEFA
ncbi:exopolyphosphatase [Thiohalobacter thiocyanaticus]|uniref:Exopolyphosphatase n=1 Tax=Thiohalobacter thiocyanaticus TaxID=585455 RepID=A0A426QHR2_9GAMM|nr:exopolyphosphatase [Thiohalobacter thiocyanaticus]RRQ21283.1 exopolyphosphatase [Thiohalobacter thiocyanaticus]